MSSPMSTSNLREALERNVASRVIGHVVLPAAPDDVCPGPGEDPLGVRMAFAAGPQLPVAVLGPDVAPPRVAGEVAQSFSKFLVGAPPEGNGPVFAGGASGWSHSSQGGERFGVGEPSPAVADLGKQGGSAHDAHSGQRREDRRIR